MIRFRCVCGHGRSHEHYRRGSDCGLCGCDRWRWRWFHPRTWRQRRRQTRALADLVQLTEELDLYHVYPSEARAAAREARKGGEVDG